MVTKRTISRNAPNPRDSTELSTGYYGPSKANFSRASLEAHSVRPELCARMNSSMSNRMLCPISRASSRARRELRCAPSHHATPRPDAQASSPMSSPSFTVTRHHPQKHHQCAKAGEPDGNHPRPFGRGGWDINMRMFNNTSRGWDTETKTQTSTEQWHSAYLTERC